MMKEKEPCSAAIWLYNLGYVFILGLRGAAWKLGSIWGKTPHQGMFMEFLLTVYTPSTLLNDAISVLNEV